MQIVMCLKEENDMKKIVGIYIVIGLFLAPFAYSNNAEGYRDSNSNSYKVGRGIASTLFWPSYLFSIEPEVKSDSLEMFQQSIGEILTYRNDKLFTGRRSIEDSQMVMKALETCLASEGVNAENLFEKGVVSKELDRARNNIMERMDGYDFLDIIEEGEECSVKLGNLKPNKGKPQ